MYICHSCLSKGGLLDLAQLLFHYNREQAVEYLRQKAGLPKQSFTQTPKKRKEQLNNIQKALREEKELVKRLLEPEPDELWEAQNRLEWLRLYKKDTLNANLRISRRNVKQYKMSMEKFYPKEEVLPI